MTKFEETCKTYVRIILYGLCLSFGVAVLLMGLYGGIMAPDHNRVSEHLLLMPYVGALLLLFARWLKN